MGWEPMEEEANNRFILVDKIFNPLFLITEHRKTENVNVHTSINCIDLLLKAKVILYII